ncbi:hypothetical protein CHISP_0682 [Chitinispirillum alkaliphilum]|nr:hypothetical protein CHISP_0682 [Chitinispirillum alkaliphilum]
MKCFLGIKADRNCQFMLLAITPVDINSSLIYNPKKKSITLVWITLTKVGYPCIMARF